MLWLALHPPALPLQAFAAGFGSARRALPLALLDGHRVAAVNRVAQQLGVKPGLKRATALALAPQLLFGPADAARDAAALRTLVHAALAFTPRVTLDATAELPCVLLEVQSSLRLFGGHAALLEQLRAALAPLQLHCRLASAPTALGAALLARWRDGFDTGAHCHDLPALQQLLDGVPPWLLGPGREHWDALQGMGLRSLSDLKRLPRSALARRFGEALLADLDRAYGLAADPREPVVPEPEFDERLELFERADRSEQLLHGAEALLQRLVAWARALQSRIGGFTLAMRHEPRHRRDTTTPEHTELALALAEASNDVQHLQGLLRERLGRLELPAPTLQLRLHRARLLRSAAQSGELFATPGSAREGLLRLVERLQARLGPEQVCQPLLHEDHRPERATAWLAAPAGARALPATAAASPPRPVWLLSQPQALPERQSRPCLDGQPLQLLAGPERIEAGWWDGATAARDYFIAQAHDGALVWIYRMRLPLAQPEGWFLQGRFG